jgi:hypothetical protein
VCVCVCVCVCVRERERERGRERERERGRGGRGIQDTLGNRSGLGSTDLCGVEGVPECGDRDGCGMSRDTGWREVPDSAGSDVWEVLPSRRGRNDGPGRGRGALASLGAGRFGQSIRDSWQQPAPPRVPTQAFRRSPDFEDGRVADPAQLSRDRGSLPAKNAGEDWAPEDKVGETAVNACFLVGEDRCSKWLVRQALACGRAKERKTSELLCPGTKSLSSYLVD